MKKRTAIIFFSILMISVVLIAFKGKADENSYKVCLFSAISGTVTLHGKPLPHITITRSANYWNKDNHTDSTITDAKGQFHFAAMMVNSRHISQSMNPIIFERIIIHHNGEEYLGWRTTRGDIQPNIELGRNKPIPELSCELSNKSKIKDVKYSHPVSGICSW